MYYLKKSCEGCRALEKHKTGHFCSLGYPIDSDPLWNPSVRPMRGCPKPKGWMRLVHCLQHETYKRS